MTIVEKAIRLAVVAHTGQVRKGNDAPYIVHPTAVAVTVARHGFSDTAIAAALVHDTVEDTSVTDEELRQSLGYEVADLVQVLTEDKSLPWRERKERYVAAVRGGPVEVKAISAADKINNLSDMLDLYTKMGDKTWELFRSTYQDRLWFEELMLSVLQSSWEHPLVHEYEVLVERMRALQ